MTGCQIESKEWQTNLKIENSCNYVRVTWASDQSLRWKGMEENANNCDWSESKWSRIECSAAKVKRRFSGWAALILTHGQVHFVYYKLHAHTLTHTHTQSTHPYTHILSLSTTLHTCITILSCSDSLDALPHIRNVFNTQKTQRLFTNFFLRQYAHRW